MIFIIYIVIDHINGEIDKIFNNIYNFKDALELKNAWGYIVIEINLITGEVKEL